MSKPKTIKLDSRIVVRVNKIESIYRYNKWNIKVYVSGNAFKIKISQDRDNAGEITDLFIKSLEALVDPPKNQERYQTVSNRWAKYNGTFKQFIIDAIDGSSPLL